jgi:hypothetical protein
MKTIYRVIKNGEETNAWIEKPGMGADYWEPCFGEPGTYELIKEVIEDQDIQ